MGRTKLINLQSMLKIVRSMIFDIISTTLEDLGWTRKVGFREGLGKTKDWYIKNTNWFGDVSTALVAHPGVGKEHDAQFFSSKTRKQIEGDEKEESKNKKI